MPRVQKTISRAAISPALLKMDAASDHELNPEKKDEDETSEKWLPKFKIRCKCYWKSFNSCYQALLLGSLVCVYLLIGAGIFVALEAPNEQRQIDAITMTRQLIIENLTMTYNLSVQEIETIVSRFTTACESDLLVTDTARIWNFGNAIFFATTVITTIGYGNLSPSTSSGQSFCVIYAIFGIPLTVAYLAVLGQLLGHVPKLILENLNDKAIYFRYLAIALIAAGGMFLFLIIPALIFMAIEGWTYRESIYYAFITLSTIGFGDFVAAQQADRPPDPRLRQFYGVCVSLWIYIGLAFLAILLTDVGGAMTSLWKKLKLRIKRGHTRFKIKKEMEELGIQPKQMNKEAGSPDKEKPPLETPQEQDTSKGPSQASNQESQQTREDETEDTSSKEEVKENLSAVEDQTTVEEPKEKEDM